MQQSCRLVQAQNQEFECCQHWNKKALHLVYKVANSEFNYFCEECAQYFTNTKEIVKISIEDAQKIIENNLFQQNQEIGHFINQQMKDFDQLLKHLQKLVIEKLKTLENYGKQWIQEINSIINLGYEYDLQIEIKSLIKTQNISDILKSIYSGKLKEIQDKYKENFFTYLEPFNFLINQQNDNCEPNLQKIIEQQKNLDNIPKKLKIDSEKIKQLNLDNIDIQLISFGEDEHTQERKYVDIHEIDEKRMKKISQLIEQPEICLAIAFNNDCTIMISTANNNIKIWDFNFNNLQEKECLKITATLKEHIDTVNCLVYSKKDQYFVSGSDDLDIICWRLQNNKKWHHQKQIQKHNNSITCFILNKNEDQLISGSNDNTIIIWKADLKNSLLQLSQNLDAHKGNIRALTLTVDESFFASCDSKKKIIIWRKQNIQGQVNWVKINEGFTENNQGNKLQFLDNQTLLWVSAQENQISFYIMNDQQTFIKKEGCIDLKKNRDEDEIYFPICFYKIANILFLRHKHNIYIVKYCANNQNLKIIQEINCHTFDVYGTASNNGEFLVFWDSIKKSYSFYRFKHF